MLIACQFRDQCLQRQAACHQLAPCPGAGIHFAVLELAATFGADRILLACGHQLLPCLLMDKHLALFDHQPCARSFLAHRKRRTQRLQLCLGGVHPEAAPACGRTFVSAGIDEDFTLQQLDQALAIGK
ncbi:hypothetical protein D3C80_1475390 [compost metagenome]